MSLESTIVSAAKRHGVSPDTLLAFAKIESRMNPRAFNKGSGASGLFQFLKGTAAQYGLTDPFNPSSAADAAARLMKDNAATLKRSLKRTPTPGELYLAHQQGVGGALKLLKNPDLPAVNVLGTDAVLKNGGNAKMTAAQFAKKWTHALGRPQSLGADAPIEKLMKEAANDGLPEEDITPHETLDDIYARLDPNRQMIEPDLTTDTGSVANDFLNQLPPKSLTEE